LADLHSEELHTLKDSVNKARRRLPSVPQNLRSRHEEELTRLELALRRAESAVNRDRREKVEMEAMNKAMKDEKKLRKQGKSAWWMKRCKSLVPLLFSL
jgi:ribosomal RNA-processing protein 36